MKNHKSKEILRRALLGNYGENITDKIDVSNESVDFFSKIGENLTDQIISCNQIIPTVIKIYISSTEFLKKTNEDKMRKLKCH